MRFLIFHAGAIAASCLAIVALTRRNHFSAVLFLGGTLMALAVSSLALGAVVLATAQVLLHAGGCVVLLLAGLLLSNERSDASRGRPGGGVIAGIAVALLFGAVLAVKITPLRENGLHAAPARIGALAAVLFRDETGSGVIFLSLVLVVILGAVAILGIKAATRSAR